jgi:hypothetical protein
VELLYYSTSILVKDSNSEQAWHSEAYEHANIDTVGPYPLYKSSNFLLGVVLISICLYQEVCRYIESRFGHYAEKSCIVNRKCVLEI